MATRETRHKWQKARDPDLSGQECPYCHAGRLIRHDGVWKDDFPVYGWLAVENARWYTCDRCKQEVIPPALDEQIECVMADVDPVDTCEKYRTSERVREQERARMARLRKGWEQTEEYRQKMRAHSMRWRAERKELEKAL